MNLEINFATEVFETNTGKFYGEVIPLINDSPGPSMEFGPFDTSDEAKTVMREYMERIALVLGGRIETCPGCPNCESEIPKEEMH